MNRKKVITFTLLAYAISWTIWGRQALNSLLDLGWTISEWNHILAGLGPFLSAVLTTLLFDKGTGVKAYFREKLFRLPTAKWLLVGLGMPLVFFLVPYGVLGLFQGSWPASSVLGYNSKVPVQHPLAVWLMWCLFYGLGEEGGWRGLLFPELAKAYPARIATFYVALIWGPWHLPVFFYDKDFMTMGPLGILGWFVGLVFGSFLLGWLVKQAHWNLWPVILWHGTFNFFTTSEQLDPLFPGIMSALVILVVLWIARRYGPELGGPSPRSRV